MSHSPWDDPSTARAIVEQSPAGVLAFDRDLRVIGFNRRLAEIIGSTGERLTGLDLSTITTPRLPIDALRAALVGRTTEYQDSLVTRAGRTLHVSVRIGPLNDDAGASVGGLCHVLDLGPTMRAQDALRASEERYRLLVERTPTPILVVADGKVVFANAAIARLMRASDPADMVGLPADLPAHPDTVELVRRRLARMARGEQVEPLVQRMRRLDGTWFEAEVHSLPIVFDGRPAVLSVAVDLTERQAVAEAERRLRAQFKSIPVPTYAWQRRGDDLVLVDFNDAAQELTMGKVRDVLGQTATEYYADSEIAQDLRRCATEGVMIRREMDYLYPSSGLRKRLVVSYCPAPPDMVLAFTEDVTEQRRLEDQLRQAQKMEAVGQLAGGIAHDFNNLLTVLLNCSSFVQERLDPDSPLQDDLDEIRRATERATALTAQLLAFGRKQVLRPRRFDLNEVVLGTSGMLRRLIGEAVRVDLRLDTLPAIIHADQGQIEQIIVNLAVNGRDAMDGSGTLTITTSRGVARPDEAATLGLRTAGPYVRLEVTDTGEGMDPTTMARAFEPFFTTKPVARGTGLGLATVYGIVRQSGGAVSVTSELGHGSTFEVRFPMDLEVPEHDEQRPGALRMPPAGVVLLVEDEPPVRTVCRRLLERLGYRVIEARDGAEALRASADYRGPIDLVLTDMIMPGAHGREVSAGLREQRPNLRVVYMSGYADDERLRRGELEPDSTFLAKPVTLESLAAAIRTVSSTSWWGPPGA